MDFNSSKKLADFIWINGKIIPWDEAYVHVLTHSLHYSGAVFEGERAYNGKVFKLTEHTNRLLKSAEYMHLQVDYSLEDIKVATEDILRKNNLKNAYIRPLIWRGAGALGAYNPVLTTNLLILAQESNPKFRNGLKLWVSPWRKIAENTIPVQAKSSAHYAMLSISQKLAQDAGYDDALLLDQFDDIAECTTTNIFFGREGELVTPIADRFLNGLIRQMVIKLARNIGIKVREERITLGDIKEYDTCFVTGTSAEIRGISSIYTGKQNVEFINDKMVAILQQEYAKIVGKEL